MFAIYKKELKGYLTSMVGYLFLTFLMLIMGLFFSNFCINEFYSDFSGTVLSSIGIGLILLVPMLTMNIFASEKRNKTDQLLFTSPISVTSVVMAKFLALMTLLGIVVVITSVFPIIISRFGTISMSSLVSGFIGFILFTACLFAIGIFISSLTDNTIISGVCTIVAFLSFYLGTIGVGLLPSNKIVTFIFLGLIIIGVMVLFYIDTKKIVIALIAGGLGSLGIIIGYILEPDWFNSGLVTITNWMSITSKYTEFTNGILNLGNIIFMLSIIVVFLFLTIQVIQKRRWDAVNNLKRGVFSSVAIVLFLIIIIIGNIFISSRNMSLDMSEEKIYSISDQTKSIVKGLDEEVTIYVLADKNDFDTGYKELLGKYTKISKKINVEYKSPKDFPNFAGQYTTTTVSAGSIIVVCDDKSYYIDSNDYVSTVQTSTYEYNNVINFEPLVTEGINTVVEDSVSVIYNITGHGEDVFEDNITSKIDGDNFTIEDSSLYDIKEIPNTVSCVIIYGPDEDFSTEDIDKITEYVKNGGNLYVVIDPVVPYLNELYGELKNYGIKVVDGVVVEKDSANYVMETAYYIFPSIIEHDITNPIINNSLSVYSMISKGLIPYDISDYQVSSLLETSEDAFSKIYMEEDISTKADGDIDGPFCIATLSEADEKGSVIVLGSTTALTNEVDSQLSGANSDFFMNGIEYMIGQADKIAMRGTVVNDGDVLYSTKDRIVIKMFALIIIPVTILIAGIIVIVRRNIRTKDKSKDEKKVNNKEKKENASKENKKNK